MKRKPVLAVALMLLLSACAQDGSGWAELPDWGVIGLLPSGQGYLCGQGEQVEESTWIQSDTMTSTDGTWTLSLNGQDFELTSEDTLMQGTLTPFEDGGLYDAAPDGCRSGAILHDGELSGTWCDGVQFRQVEPIDPFDGGPQQIQVQPLDDPDRAFTMTRLP
ncbi:MAG: hypothetical protein VX899_04065 [Myxococcota bacterium]|nr:hypothetical protein [Myxococcota bacterium]